MGAITAPRVAGIEAVGEVFFTPHARFAPPARRNQENLEKVDEKEFLFDGCIIFASRWLQPSGCPCFSTNSKCGGDKSDR
jgi:hypothetical protein